jgi:transcriptional regulator with XRE-family HTH domain
MSQSHSDALSDLIDDFVFRDRRVADHPSINIRVFLDAGDGLNCVARSRFVRAPLDLAPLAPRSVSATVVSKSRLGDSAEETLLASDAGTRARLAMPLLTPDPDASRGVLLLESRAPLEFSEMDVARLRVLSALVVYDVFHLQRKLPFQSSPSAALGQVLGAARREMNLSQEELATRVAITRISLSRWEEGAQAPTRGPLRRWAAALGLLAGGESQLITVVDATHELVRLVEHQPERLQDLSPEQFELFVAECLDRMGYAVSRTGNTRLRDGGIDIIAMPKLANAASFLLAVQTKHHRTGHPTGREAVDRLLAWQNTAFRLGMLVTNTRFTRDAVWAASQDPGRHFLRLRDFSDLSRWLLGVFASELDWREVPDAIELAPGVSVRVPKPRFREAGLVWPLDKDAIPDA